MHKVVWLVFASLGFAVYALSGIAARDEVYYLCGNFKQGVSYLSVVRQLETSSLSDYLREDGETGVRIVHSSALHFHSIQCTILFDANQEVSRSVYSWG
ncbi:hypothetical protein N9N48_03485 [Luminiphilus sp.]|nr:hypothetical protein [Luminiphilus sp.]